MQVPSGVYNETKYSGTLPYHPKLSMGCLQSLDWTSGHRT